VPATRVASLGARHGGRHGTAGTVAAGGIMDMAYPCGLTNPAFCDNFTENAATGGGREGALDPAKWDYTRFTNAVNVWQGMFNEFYPTDAQHCKTLLHNVVPYNDSFFCGLEVPEPQHWMEAYNDASHQVVTDGMIRQPFDFTGRTGTIQFGVDAKSDASHTWWPEVLITDEPVPSPHDAGAFLSHPRNGLRIQFDGSDKCPGTSLPPAGSNDTAGMGYNYISRIEEFVNYQMVELTTTLPVDSTTCFKTAPDTTNLVQIQVSTTQVDVYVSNAGTNVLQHAASAAIAQPLPFSVGYVHFEHVQYNAAKEGASSMQTYHWHDMGFDGPVHAPLRAYDLPDPLTPEQRTFQVNGVDTTGTAYELGYRLGTGGLFDANGQGVAPFTLPAVDLTNAVGASLNLGYWPNDATTVLQYSLNGGPWQAYSDPNGNAPLAWHSLHIPLALSGLVQGSNTIALRASNDLGAVVSGGDLSLALVDNPQPAPAAPMIPCSLMQLMMLSMPNMTMLSDPCANGTPMPTGTSMPTSTIGTTKSSNTPNPPCAGADAAQTLSAHLRHYRRSPLNRRPGRSPSR